MELGPDDLHDLIHSIPLNCKINTELFKYASLNEEMQLKRIIILP